MKCPPGREPFRYTPDGPMPLLVPEFMLERARLAWPKLWIEAMPPVPPLPRAMTYADMGWTADASGQPAAS